MQPRATCLATMLLVGASACSDVADDLTGPGGTRPGWSVVAPGARHVCGLRDGKVYCWGAPITGPVQDPGVGSVTAPVAVATDLTFVDLDSGGRHTCGLTANGNAYCWGQNRLGQLGNGSDIETADPTPVAGGLRFATLSVGDYHTCGLTDDGLAYCWGGGGIEVDGRDLALGHQPAEMCQVGGYYSPRCTKTPRLVEGGLAFAQISAGLFHSCGVTRNGVAFCWGWNRGMLGIGETSLDGDAVGYGTPVAVSGGHSFMTVSAGNLHSCGLTNTGTALCWGGETYNQGQLGTGQFDRELVPRTVLDVDGLSSVVATKENSIYALNTCALTSGGVAYCWGADAEGQLGTDAVREDCGDLYTPAPCSSHPLPVSGGFRFRTVRTGLEFACGVTVDGSAYCWGLNTSGQLGNGVLVSSRTPTKVIEPS